MTKRIDNMMLRRTAVSPRFRSRCLSLRFSRLICVSFAILLLSTSFALSEAPKESIDSAAKTKVPSSRQLTDDPPLPIDPVKPRSEQATLNLKAAALFAAGRVHERRGELSKALGRYQRAARYDPSATHLKARVVLIAQDLDRHEVAARWATLLSEQQPDDPLILLRALIYLDSEEDFERGVQLYQRAWTKAQDAKQSIIWTELHKVAGGLYYHLEKFPESATAFARVQDALDNPRKYGIDQEAKKIIQGNRNALFQIMGNTYLRAGRNDEAAAAFQVANDASPSEAFRLYSLARVSASRGNHEQALAELEIYFEKRLITEGSGPYHLLQEVFVAQNKQTKLLDYLKDLHQQDPDNALLGYFLAKQYLQAKQPDKAREHLTKHLATQPSAEGYRMLVRLDHQAKKIDALRKTLTDVVAKSDSLSLLGDELQTLASDQAFCKALFQQARELEKDSKSKSSTELRLAMALLAIESQQFSVAKEFYNLVLTDDEVQKSAVVLSWGIDLLMAKKYPLAIEVFQRGIREKVLPKNDPTLPYYLAGALAMNEQYDESLIAARKAIAAGVSTTGSPSPEYQDRLGWILLRAERNQEAQVTYESLIETYDEQYDPPETRDLIREARLTLSHLYVLAKQPALGEVLIEEVLDEFPEDIGAKNDLAYLWAEQGKNLSLALSMAREAVAGEPENEAYLDTLGWTLLRRGQAKEAVAELEKATDGKDNPDAVILDHLGDAYLQHGKKTKAFATWRRAVIAFDKEKEPDKRQATQNKIDQHLESR